MFSDAMLLIHTALAYEAEPLTKHLELKRDPRFKAARVFSSESILLLVGGVGSQKTAAAISGLTGVLGRIMPPQEVGAAVNIGTCGAAATLKIGMLYQASEVLSHFHSKKFFPDTFFDPELPRAKLQSFEVPLRAHDPAATEIELADMEGFAFLESMNAHFSEATLLCLKIISDHLDLDRFDRGTVAALFRPHLPRLTGVLKAFCPPSPVVV